MNVYDKAHELAACMKESEEYRDYKRLREAAYEDSTNKALLDEYKKLQFQAQVQLAKMLADIYKILGDAAGIDLDMLRS